MSAIISLKQVCFGYRHQPVLEQINLNIDSGEFLGIVGPNGGGKTTLLKIILGLLSPTSGTVTVLGTTADKARTRLGYVPQFATFDSAFPISVRATVLQGRLGCATARWRYCRHDHAIATRVMEETDVAALERRPMAALSGGQRQRVLIARALACQPEVLLLDEPTANVDPDHGESIFELLQRLHRQMTIVLISHDIAFISRAVTSVACLNRTLVRHPVTAADSCASNHLYSIPVNRIDHATCLHNGGNE